MEGSRERAEATALGAHAPAHMARRAALEAEVLAQLAAHDGPQVSDEERAEGLLFDSG